MNLEAREYLKRHIRVKLEMEPDSKPFDVENWILAGDHQFNFKLVKPMTLRNFIAFNVSKMKETGSVDRKIGSGGHNSLKKTDAARIRRLALNKTRRSTRKVAAMVGVARQTVANVLKKPLHQSQVCKVGLEPVWQGCQWQHNLGASGEHRLQCHGEEEWPLEHQE